jgi:hypothetical protein
MRWSQCVALAAIVAVALLSLVLAGCIVTVDSPAPGCREYIGIAPMGGCSGKTAILDLEVEPEPACLTIQVNNCNGGVLEVHNACDETLVLGGVEIPASTSVGLDVAEKQETGYSLTRAGGNFSTYTPDEDERVELTGALGNVAIKVTFTKTKQLCE